MVKGLERFREHFKGHEASYALIGGAACDILFGEAGLPFRATRDFDIVLCVEVVGAEFGTVFADCLEAGGYRARERSTGQWEFYRFHRPADDTFPATIELFARRPDTQLLPEGAELAPIAVEEDVISLSAILLDDNYFDALRNMRRVIGDISLVDERILIPFKARAFLDLAQRRANGEAVDARHIRKQRAMCSASSSCCRARVASHSPIPCGPIWASFSGRPSGIRASTTRRCGFRLRWTMRQQFSADTTGWTVPAEWHVRDTRKRSTALHGDIGPRGDPQVVEAKASMAERRAAPPDGGRRTLAPGYRRAGSDLSRG